jgi:hypothetical protein
MRKAPVRTTMKAVKDYPKLAIAHKFTMNQLLDIRTEAALFHQMGLDEFLDCIENGHIIGCSVYLAHKHKLSATDFMGAATWIAKYHRDIYILPIKFFNQTRFPHLKSLQKLRAIHPFS